MNHDDIGLDGRSTQLTPRSRQAVVSFVLLVLVAAVLALLPVPFVALSPGPTFNTIGEYKSTQLITIRERRTYESAGHLDLVTIRETGGPEGGLDVFTALRGWFDPNIDVLPRSVLYPPQATEEQVKQENKELFADSQGEAVAAAMAYLKIPTTLRVIAGSVSVDGPAADVVSPGDEFVRVNDVNVTSPQDVVQAVRGLPVGSKVTMRLRSGGKVSTVTVTTKQHPEHPGKSYIGVGVGSIAKPPFPIAFGLERVGGPSAGMMFALGLVDKLTPGSMTGGAFVAGTGTIRVDGTVGGIGGIKQKMVGAKRAGAVLFLAPRENCDEVVGNIPKGLAVAAVSDLKSAVSAVASFRKSGSAGIPACRQ